MAGEGSERLKIVHHSRRNSEATVRVVRPYGVLIGMRRYLVAKSLSDPDGPLRYFVADKIQSAELTGEFFERDQNFDIDQHAQKAFGAFQNEQEFDEVV
jgi:predicted DNA-binding transcriptional regulator YafY